MKCDGVAEAEGGYRADSDYEHEHRFAEHEHEAATEPEPSAAARRLSSVHTPHAAPAGELSRSGRETIVLVLSRWRRCSCS
jgi:hypothetical protein